MHLFDNLFSTGHKPIQLSFYMHELLDGIIHSIRLLLICLPLLKMALYGPDSLNVLLLLFEFIYRF